VAGPGSTGGFAGRLAAAVAERESQVVLGLDPDPARVWPQALDADPRTGDPAVRAAEVVVAHCSALIGAAGPACVAIKPQVACFERLGAPGWAALDRVAAAARAAGLLVLADGKRGDIDVTATAYAQTFLGATPTPFGTVQGLGADALTVNPYLGDDAVRPFVTPGRGLFVLVRTVEPGGGGPAGRRPRRRRPRVGARRPHGRRAGARGRPTAGRSPTSARSSAPRSPSTWLARASSCPGRCSCCPGSEPRAAASRTWPLRSRPAAPAAW
jgi:orotidine-5'-phosphate decarboxylase